MKLILNTLIAISLSVCSFGGTRSVEGKGEGKYYNDVWKSWSTQPITVYVDSDGNFYLAAGGSLINARGYMTAVQLSPLIESLKKGQDWAKKAKDSQLEVTKEIADFMKPSGHDMTGVKLTFFAANKGQQTDVIMFVKDFDNMFSKIELYLAPEQVSKLIDILSKVPATYKELKEQEAKAAALN